MLLSDVTETPLESIREQLQTPLGMGAAVLVSAIVIFILAHFSGRLWYSMFGPPPKAPEDNLKERLVEYPPAPGKPGPRRLTVEGLPVRVRLIVVAPVGRSRPIDPESVNDLLNNVVRGLKEIIQKDKPRIRVWGPQLSNTGFAPIFHRLAETQTEDGEASHWVLVAGPASAAGQPILLGLAVHADEANELGKLTVSAERWAETVRVQTIEE